MSLWLRRSQVEQLLQLAHNQAPHEACGLLGSVDGRVARVVPIANVAATPTRRFELDPAQYLRAIFEFEREGLEPGAIWHSHPQGAPVPSAEDIRHASWPAACHLIIGTGAGQSRLAAWRIHDGEVTRVPLHIGERPPAAAQGEESRLERSAICLGAVAATLLLLWLAWTLLPPAPRLP